MKTKEEIFEKATVDWGITNNEVKERIWNFINPIMFKADLVEDLGDRLNDGRNYLMQVDPSRITVEDTLEAFGYNKNGYVDM